MRSASASRAPQPSAAPAPGCASGSARRPRRPAPSGPGARGAGPAGAVPATFDAATSNDTSARVLALLACCPPGPPLVVKRHSSSSAGMTRLRVTRSEPIVRGAVAQGLGSTTTGFSRVPTRVDLDADDVTVDEPPRGVEAHPDPGRRPRRDDVTGLEGEDGRQVLDLLPAREDHVVGRRVLAQFPVDPGAQAEAMGVTDLVRRHEPGPRRAVGVEGLPERPRRGPPLPVAHGHVVEDGEAGHHRGGVGGRHVPTAAADDHGQLALVVDLGRDRRDLDGVARPDHTGPLLVEPHLVLGPRRPGLGHVGGVVEPDAEHLGGMRDRGAQMAPGPGAVDARPSVVASSARSSAAGPATRNSVMSPGSADRRIGEVHDHVVDDHPGPDHRGCVGFHEAHEPHAATVPTTW